MENFDDFVASYWQCTEIAVLPLPQVVDDYFHSIPFSNNKNRLLTQDWDATKHMIVKGLLKQERLCKPLAHLGPFQEFLFQDMDRATDSNIYIRWNELYIRL